MELQCAPMDTTIHSCVRLVLIFKVTVLISRKHAEFDVDFFV